MSFIEAHPFIALVMLWLAVVGFGHVAKIVVKLIEQPFLFYRHIAEGRRMATHRAEMRKIYALYGTSREATNTISKDFEEIDRKLAA